MVRVLVAEDSSMVRGAMAALLGLEGGIEVVGRADNAESIVDEAQRVSPDVTIIDLGVPGLDGLGAAGQLFHQVPKSRTLALIDRGRPGGLMWALKAHARGVMFRDIPMAELARAVHRVADGERVMDPELLSAELQTPPSPLSVRETDVLRAAGSGSTIQQAGEELSLSVTTLRHYLASAVRKVGANDHTEAIRIARQSGWI